MTMRTLSMLALACLLTFFAAAPQSAEPARTEAATETTKDATAAKAKKTGNRKFCCKTDSGTACYVFGKASCSNCTKFCSGDMVIEPMGVK